MAKKKQEVIEEIVVEGDCECCVEPKVPLLTETFGNGDLNILRDKINEIIKAL